MNKDNVILALDYLISGVPPGPLLGMSLEDLSELVRSSPKKRMIDTTIEVSIIGLVSYFEAFCKNQFAAIINICPEVLENFVAKRGEVKVSVRDIISIEQNNLKNKLGFILSENYDFGSAKSINGLFYDLLSVTPFSKNDIKKYTQLINDRNLLVHHGGIYTSRYQGQKFMKRSFSGRVFFDSLVITKSDFETWFSFIRKLAQKIVNICYKALNEFIELKGLLLDDERAKALEFLKGYEL